MISEKMKVFVEGSSIIRAMFEEGKKMAKIYGKVSKMRPGPAPGSIPAANTAGMMANPARIENSKAASTVPAPEATRFSSLCTYDEYVRTIPIPRDIE